MLSLNWPAMRSFALVMTSAALLAGCATTGKGVPALPPLSEADMQIAEAVEISSRANQAIAETEVAVAAPKRAGPNQTVPPNVDLPEELVEPITIDWQGQVEPLLEAIATRIGYRFVPTGRKPAVPVMLTMNARNEAVHDIVRRVGNMVHDHADVALNPSSKTIELRYGG